MEVEGSVSLFIDSVVVLFEKRGDAPNLMLRENLIQRPASCNP